MIRLIDLLKENQYAPLYHATSYVNFLSIIDDNKIKPNRLGYIFLTRDKNYRVGGDTTPIVFKIDQEKIRQRYKIRPRVGWISNANQRIEAEEVVKGVIPLDWVQEIQVPKQIINRIKEEVKSSKIGLEWAKKNNPKVIQIYSDSIKTCTTILNHPKLSITPD